MKKFLLRAIMLMFCVGSALSGYSQEETAGKPNVFIDYFTRSTSVPFLWAENLRSCVIEGINNTNRVDLIDVDSQDALRVEQARRESGELSDGNDMERLAVMTQQGANFLIQGTVTSITTSTSKLDDGTIYYTATCAYTLKVINPKDGKLVSTKTFKHGDGIMDGVTGDTKDEAVSKVCKKAIKAVRELVEDAFKLQGTILEIAVEKRDKAEEVYISLGAAHGVGPDAWFSVCVARTVAGRQSLKEIGRLKVKDVEGDDLTLCEVKKGEKEILAAFKGGQELVVKNMRKPTIVFDQVKAAANSL